MNALLLLIEVLVVLSPLWARFRRSNKVPPLAGLGRGLRPVWLYFLAIVAFAIIRHFTSAVGFLHYSLAGVVVGFLLLVTAQLMSNHGGRNTNHRSTIASAIIGTVAALVLVLSAPLRVGLHPHWWYHWMWNLVVIVVVLALLALAFLALRAANIGFKILGVLLILAAIGFIFGVVAVEDSSLHHDKTKQTVQGSGGSPSSSGTVTATTTPSASSSANSSSPAASVAPTVTITKTVTIDNVDTSALTASQLKELEDVHNCAVKGEDYNPNTATCDGKNKVGAPVVPPDAVHEYSVDKGVPARYFGEACPSTTDAQVCRKDLEERIKHDPNLASTLEVYFGMLPDQAKYKGNVAKVEAARKAYAQKLYNSVKLRQQVATKLTKFIDGLHNLHMEPLSGVYKTEYIDAKKNIHFVVKVMDPKINFAMFGRDTKTGKLYIIKVDCGYQPEVKLPPPPPKPPVTSPPTTPPPTTRPPTTAPPTTTPPPTTHPPTTPPVTTTPPKPTPTCYNPGHGPTPIGTPAPGQPACKGKEPGAAPTTNGGCQHQGNCTPTSSSAPTSKADPGSQGASPSARPTTAPPAIPSDAPPPPPAGGGATAPQPTETATTNPPIAG